LSEKIPRKWQMRLDETHQKKPETATFTHDRESCLRWELAEATQKDKDECLREQSEKFQRERKQRDNESSEDDDDEKTESVQFLASKCRIFCS
ncbi:MAG: hypothetical protein GY861_23365, partial [bacterium]|nr:hypothetical protein [bacterium]